MRLPIRSALLATMPSALPEILAGVRQGAIRGVKGVVIERRDEYYASTRCRCRAP